MDMFSLNLKCIDASGRCFEQFISELVLFMYPRLNLVIHNVNNFKSTVFYAFVQEYNFYEIK